MVRFILMIQVIFGIFQIVSIPLWFDSYFDRVIIIDNMFEVSIPLWFDSYKKKFSVFKIIKIWVSIPLWFDSYSRISEIQDELKESLNTTMVRFIRN